ncbi:uncharacterized protein LOC144421088 [Styela clava]
MYNETEISARNFASLDIIFGDSCHLRNNNPEMNAIEKSCSISDERVLTFRVVLSNNTVEGNSSTFAITHSGEVFYQSRPFILKYCTNSDIPDNLLMETPSIESYSYGEYNATCASNDLFLSGSDYTTGMAIKCGRYAEWEIPQYVCDRSCIRAAFENYQPSYGKQFAAKYRINSRLSVTCVTGRMYFIREIETESYFIPTAQFLCNAYERWEIPRVDCWAGHSIDFLYSSITIHSGDPIIIACKSSKPSKFVKLTVANDVIKGKSAWLNLTATPDHHEVTATCDELDETGRVVQRNETTLLVQYSPELIPKEPNLEFVLQIGKSGRVVIRFRVNPSVSMSNVIVTRNGTVIPNYYLVVKGINHKIVVDFLQVDENDFGNYVITVTSPFSMTTSLVTEFKVSKTTYTDAFLSPGDIGFMTLSVILVIILISTVVLVVKRKLWQSRKPDSDRKTDVTVDAHEMQECHNYEDIDEKRNVDEGNASDGNYVNTILTTGTRQNTYNIDRQQNQATGQHASTTALKPSAYENRDPAAKPTVTRDPFVARSRKMSENPYGYDN